MSLRWRPLGPTPSEWPKPLGEACWEVNGEARWVLEGDAELIAEAKGFLGAAAAPVGAGALLVEFGNAVGRIPLGRGGEVVVVSRKWGEAHFDLMLAELSAVAAALPFAAEGGGALPYDRSVVTRHDVLYHAFVYLRHVVTGSGGREKGLCAALESVLRDPVRLLVREAVTVPLHQASRIDGRTFADVAAGRHPLVRWETQGGAGGRLAEALSGHLPAEVSHVRAVTSLDTPENRFVKAFLALCGGVVDGMRDVARKGGFAAPERVLSDCGRIEEALAPIRRHRLWHEVGPMTHLPASSQVLQRRRGYKEVFGHFAKLRLGSRLPLDETASKQLLELKDIALLYELWTFFAAVEAVEELLGAPRTARLVTSSATSLDVDRGLEVRWPGGVVLAYNRSFSRSGTRWTSYSTPLRPDISLEVPTPSGPAVHLLDAKFKVDAVPFPVVDGDAADVDDPSIDREERGGTFKRGDLYKMHTYRDAIRGARTAWILYPGTTFRFHSTSGSVATGVDQLQAGSLEGVGAVPLRPGEGHAHLTGVLGHLLGAVDTQVHRIGSA